MSAIGDDPGGLDELAAARLAEGRAVLAGLVSEYDRLNKAMIAERDEPMAADSGQWVERVEWPAQRAFLAWDEAIAGRLASLPAEQQRCLLFALAERLAAGNDEYYSPPSDWFEELIRRPPGLVAGDVRLLAVVAEPGAGRRGYRPFEFVVDSTERLLRDGALGAGALADVVADQACGWNVMVHHWYGADSVLRGSPAKLRERELGSDVAELRDKALELAGRPPAWPALEGPVSRDDGWGLAVLGWLGVAEDWPTGVKSLLEHCATARMARPGPKWDKTCRQRLDAVADPAGLARHLLELVVSTEPIGFLTDDGRRMLLVGFNEQLIKGIVWAAGLLDPPWLPDVLRAVAVRCLRLCSGHVSRDTAVQGEKIPYACFRALAASSSDASLVALARIGQATSHGAVLKNLATTLAEAAVQRGMSAASLLDQLTPDHGIGPDGQVSVDTDAGTWVIRLNDRDGAVAEGPRQVQADIPPRVREALAEIKATVSGVRARLEALFAERRQWHADDFTDCYLRHPLVCWLAARLAWTFTPTDGGPPIRASCRQGARPRHPRPARDRRRRDPATHPGARRHPRRRRAARQPQATQADQGLTTRAGEPASRRAD